MKKKIVFATHNVHKLREVSALLKENFEVVGLTDIGCMEDIPETADTFAGNARIKSEHVYKNYGLSCFSDDSGLEVEALNGAPGVYSARYAGEAHNDTANNEKLLQELKGVENRKARFRTVVSLIVEGNETTFEGFVEGTILETPRGQHGFGYDPLFQPMGYSQSFAELGDEVKNTISHRARAIQKLVAYLQNL